jgi:hypothetical protein
MFCQRIVEWWADAGVLAGVIPLSKRDAARNPEHSPQGWDYIHPVQDVQGKVLAINAGLTSRTREISALGDDPKKIDAERAEDKAREDKLGLTPAPVDGDEPADEDEEDAKPGPAPKPKNPKPKPSNDMTALLAVMTQQMGLMQNLLATIVAQQTQNAAPAQTPVAQAAPSFIVHNHLPESAPVVNVAAPNVTVEPPAITIEPQVVNVAAPTVNVEPPAVTVNAPNVSVTNEVQPAAVQVDVSLPPRETTSVIDRDARGDIKKVVQTERTIN